MNILLFGTMGAGKTTIGQQLAKKLNFKFIEFDNVVLEYTGQESIKEVFSKRPSFWKECEIEAAKDYSKFDRMVIACGGGFLDNDINLMYFKENDHPLCVYLYADKDTLAQRSIERKKIENKDIDYNKVKESIDRVFEKRDFVYRQSADLIIETSKKTVQETLLDIVNQIILTD